MNTMLVIIIVVLVPIAFQVVLLNTKLRDLNKKLEEIQKKIEEKLK